ncbi:MAG TPA: class I SAM-dependent methyltransferase [Planctomycetaceae bacterium]|nr:class I SAM-dependent methyltransferase [Planctomycetaceae bacterium]HIQ22401.1 class I SAM-dependent methyltransferase [Planctomycetota bacterium]
MSGRVEPGAVPERVRGEILQRNPWYVGSQFEWAERPEVRRIYEKRYEFIAVCIERARARRGAQLRVLDAGCGDGYWLWRLERLPGLELVGVDYNPVRVQRARSVTCRARVVQSDLAWLERCGPFDVILLNQVIEHVPDDEQLLVAAHRALDPCGTLILGTPNEGAWLQQLWLRVTGQRAATDHVHFYTEAEIRGKIHRAGFRVEAVMREVFFPGSYRIYYWLTARHWGFRLLERLALAFPGQCSDYYFECVA